MLRLVVIHQLVLSLLVGPMLCCCTTARLGDGHPFKLLSQYSTKSTAPAQHCCGGDHPKSDSKESSGGQRSPTECPCKAYPPLMGTATVGSSTSSLLLTILLKLSTLLTVALPRSAFALTPSLGICPTATFCVPLPGQMLFLCHNLRC